MGTGGLPDILYTQTYGPLGPVRVKVYILGKLFVCVYGTTSNNHVPWPLLPASTKLLKPETVHSSSTTVFIKKLVEISCGII